MIIPGLKRSVEMMKVYRDKFQMECSFTEEGIYFCNSRRNVYFPYGCLDSLSLSFLGVMQAVSRAQVCCFTVSRPDKAEIKELVQKAKEAMKSASRTEPVIVDLDKLPVEGSLPAEEQLKQYKALYVQGMLSRDQFNLMKTVLSN